MAESDALQKEILKLLERDYPNMLPSTELEEKLSNKREDIFKSVKYLDEMDYVEATWSIGTNFLVKITADGINYLRKLEGKEKDLTLYAIKVQMSQNKVVIAGILIAFLIQIIWNSTSVAMFVAITFPPLNPNLITSLIVPASYLIISIFLISIVAWAYRLTQNEPFEDSYAYNLHYGSYIIGLNFLLVTLFLLLVLVVSVLRELTYPAIILFFGIILALTPTKHFKTLESRTITFIFDFLMGTVQYLQKIATNLQGVAKKVKKIKTKGDTDV
ncbi:MAG: hypothetical protein NTX79_06555 [Candidatus Micrarchaeota archaeon]|nr:hypothetical protein [Candidatus Micrarchaeota archaeon]